MSERLLIPENLRERGIRIATMGAVGVGKSTLAQLLGERWGGLVIEEKHVTNPYLEDFYKDKKKYCFRSQYFFLYNGLKQLSNEAMDGRAKIYDPWPKEMNPLYAEINYRLGNMSEAEIELYRDYNQTLSEVFKVPEPDLFLVLLPRDEEQAERIRGRGRDYEIETLDDDPDYYYSLNHMVKEWADTFPDRSKIHVVNPNANFLEKGSFDQECELGRIEMKISLMLAGNNFGKINGEIIIPPYKSTGYKTYDTGDRPGYTDGKSFEG